VHFKDFDPDHIPTTAIKIYNDMVQVPQYAVVVEDSEKDIVGLSVLTKVSIRVSWERYRGTLAWFCLLACSCFVVASGWIMPPIMQQKLSMLLGGSKVY
jgi:hypothetical protein